MTRNEWIAETAILLSTNGRLGHGGRTAYGTFDECIEAAKWSAQALEADSVAPWIDDVAAPPMPDAAAKVVEAAVNYIRPPRRRGEVNVGNILTNSCHTTNLKA